jgi:hypothetical protein
LTLSLSHLLDAPGHESRNFLRLKSDVMTQSDFRRLVMSAAPIENWETRQLYLVETSVTPSSWSAKFFTKAPMRSARRTCLSTGKNKRARHHPKYRQSAERIALSSTAPAAETERDAGVTRAHPFEVPFFADEECARGRTKTIVAGALLCAVSFSIKMKCS